MRGDSDDWVSLVAKSILTAIVTDASEREFSGPFTLDDFLRAWIEHDSALIDGLPEPPGRKIRSATQARTSGSTRVATSSRRAGASPR
jgi:hypothetical protein